MIDSDLIDSMEEPHRTILKEALGEIALSGVILTQIARELERLGHGDPTQPQPEFELEVREYRRKRAMLDSFQSLAEQFVTEKDNA